MTVSDMSGGKDHVVIEQVALCVKHHHFAARADARVHAHDTLLPEWCGKQQLTQVLTKHLDGLVVGFFLAQRGELCLHLRAEKALEGIVDGFADDGLAGSCAVDIVALEFVSTFLLVGTDGHAQHSLGLAAAHGQQAVGRAASQLLAEEEVIGIFLCLVLVAHLRYHT